MVESYVICGAGKGDGRPGRSQHDVGQRRFHFKGGKEERMAKDEHRKDVAVVVADTSICKAENPRRGRGMGVNMTDEDSLSVPVQSTSVRRRS